MNVKLITKAMHALSLLSEEDVAMVMKLRGLSDDERQMLMLVLEPNTKPQKKPANKPRTIEHCDACDYTRRHQVHKDATVSGYHEFQPKKSAGKKSERASGIAAQLNKQLGGRRQESELLNDITSDSGQPCAKCSLRADANIHHLQTQDDYHEFQPATAAAVSGD